MPAPSSATPETLESWLRANAVNATLVLDYLRRDRTIFATLVTLAMLEVTKPGDAL